MTSRNNQNYGPNESGSFRRFAPGFERPTPDELSNWFVGEMVDYNGKIVHPYAHAILKVFFDVHRLSPNSQLSDFSIPAVVLAEFLGEDPFKIRSVCRQLCTHRLLEESPAFSCNFRISTRILPSVVDKLKDQLDFIGPLEQDELEELGRIKNELSD